MREYQSGGKDETTPEGRQEAKKGEFLFPLPFVLFLPSRNWMTLTCIEGEKNVLYWVQFKCESHLETFPQIHTELLFNMGTP